MNLQKRCLLNRLLEVPSSDGFVLVENRHYQRLAAMLGTSPRLREIAIG